MTTQLQRAGAEATAGTEAKADAAAAAAAHNAKLRWALASLSLSMLLSSLGTSVANVGLPTLASSLGATFQQVQWVVLAYLLAITTLIVSVGRLGDVLGRRRLLLAGIALFTLASALCSLAPTLALLIAARALQGLGAAVMMALTMALVGEVIPKSRTGSAMGLLGTMSAVGTALGPTLGGALIATAGWRAMFLINLPLGALAWALAQRHLPGDRPSPAAPPQAPLKRYDPAGTLLLAGSLAAYALAMTTGRGSFGMLNLALLALAAAGTALFLRIEARAPSPLVPLALLRDRRLGAAFAMSALVSTVVMATLVVGPFYLAGALGLDVAQAGLVMSSGPVAAALVGVPAGRTVDRYGPQRAGIVGLLAMAVGTGTLVMLPAQFGVPGYVGPLVVVTAGYALFQAANNTAVMVDVGPERRGLVSGLLTLSRNLGLITGASLMGALFIKGTAASASDSGATAVAAGMHLAFAVAAALIVLALFIAWAGHVQASRERAPGR